MLVSLTCVMVSEMILQRGSWSQGEDRAVRSAKTQIGNLFAIEEPIVCCPCLHEGGRGGLRILYAGGGMDGSVEGCVEGDVDAQGDVETRQLTGRLKYLS